MTTLKSTRKATHSHCHSYSVPGLSPLEVFLGWAQETSTVLRLSHTRKMLQARRDLLTVLKRTVPGGNGSTRS